MTNLPKPLDVGLGGSSSWTSVSDEAVRSLHVRPMIGIDASAALVIRRELVDGHGHAHGRVVDLVLGCDDPAEAEHRLRAVEHYSGSPLLTVKAMRIIGPERFARQISVVADALGAAAAAEDEAAADLARRSAELDRTIVVRKSGGKAQPRVELRRGASTDAFWSIRFGGEMGAGAVPRLVQVAAPPPRRVRGAPRRERCGLPQQPALARDDRDRAARAQRNRLTTSGRRPLRLWCGKAE